MQRGAQSFIVDCVAVVSVSLLAWAGKIEGHAALWLISTIAAVRYQAPREGIGGLSSLASLPRSLFPRSLWPRRGEREPDTKREPRIRSNNDSELP